MNKGERHENALPHPSALLGNTQITESVMKMHPQRVPSMHGSENDFQPCFRFEQHVAQKSLRWHLPVNATLRLSVSQSLSCSSHQTRAFGLDARHDMDTLTSIYVNSDDAAGYALAW